MPAPIDARSAPDPSEAADRQASTVPGASGSARHRALLLRQALACRLCEFLVTGVLEGPTLERVKDPSAARVHSLELLKLLTMDPGYGPKFRLILEHYPAWKNKYKLQDHSLYITSRGEPSQAESLLLLTAAATPTAATATTTADAAPIESSPNEVAEEASDAPPP
jgi:hypothetical protein